MYGGIRHDPRPVDPFYVDPPLPSPTVNFEKNGVVTLHLLRGGERDAEHAGSVGYLGVDDQHRQVSLRPRAGLPSEEILTEAHRAAHHGPRRVATARRLEAL